MSIIISKIITAIKELRLLLFNNVFWTMFSLITLCLLYYYAINFPFHGDEEHFVKVIHLFANNFTIETIKDYPETTPPLFYIIYALWAKVFSPSLESLRILTLLISFVAWQLVYLLNSLYTKNKIHTFLLSLLIIINPYFFGLSVFVFTDMLTIMFCLSAVIFFLKNKNILFLIFSTLAILCRQYAVILPVSAIAFWVLQSLAEKRVNKLLITGAALTLIPLLFVFFLWGNIVPASGLAKWVIPNSSFYNIDYINTYITFTVIYLFPIIIFLFCKIKFTLSNLLLTAVASFILILFPVKTSNVTLIQTDFISVGFAHKTLIQILGNGTILLNMVSWFLLFVGCYTNVLLIRGFAVKLKNKIINKEMLFTLLWFSFLLVLPLSYQVWEKYLTIILPYLTLSIYLSIYPLHSNEAFKSSLQS